MLTLSNKHANFLPGISRQHETVSFCCKGHNSCLEVVYITWWFP